MNYSPLRYPGGKSKLAPFIKELIQSLEIKDCVYIEPFAGGAGVALALLMNNHVDQIVINDYDKAIYSFWKAVICDTEKLLNLIYETPVSIEQWHRQKEIYDSKNNKYSVELGFATFFLNRTNRSGILKAGPIGGYDQLGNYLIDARYNKDKLIKKIEMIAANKKKIKVYNKEIRSFIKYVIPKYAENGFVYFDPPYFVKGHELYKNFFKKEDHIKIANSIMNDVRCDWIITYDDVEEIENIYKGYTIKKYSLNYSVSTNRKGREIIILKKDTYYSNIKELEEKKIHIELQ